MSIFAILVISNSFSNIPIRSVFADEEKTNDGDSTDKTTDTKTGDEENKKDSSKDDNDNNKDAKTKDEDTSKDKEKDGATPTAKTATGDNNDIDNGDQKDT